MTEPQAHPTDHDLGDDQPPAPDRPAPDPGDGPVTAADVVSAVRARGGRVVATGGCFDVLHRGHVTYLRQARALGDLPPGARLDDALDALAAAWSAQRWAAGTAEVLGEELDDRGRPMRVVV